MRKPKGPRTRIKIEKLEKSFTALNHTEQKKIKGGAGSVGVFGDGSVRSVKDGTSNTIKDGSSNT